MLQVSDVQVEFVFGVRAPVLWLLLAESYVCILLTNVKEKPSVK